MLLDTILTLPEKAEAVRLFSHLITSQNKWLNRLVGDQPDSELGWFGTVFSEQQLAQEWEKSYAGWLSYLNAASEAELESFVYFTGNDRSKLKVLLKDIVFQLNCHSVHHRAQINRLISEQGVKVPPTDYIRMAVLPADEDATG